MDKIYSITNEKDLCAVIKNISKNIVNGVIYLHGDLGSGKTTCVRAWLRQLGVKEAVNSPTYALLHEYDSDLGLILHADLYRLNHRDELLLLDVREWQDRSSLIFIEWPEKGIPIIPNANCHLNLRLDANGCRTLQFNA